MQLKVTNILRDMVSLVRKRIALRRKLQILRTLTKSKSVKKSAILMDAFLHIHLLKLKLQAVQRDYLQLMTIKTHYLNYLIKHFHVPKEVKVEKIEGGFLVRVTCEKAGDTLVSILQAFEEMGLNVVQARVSCSNSFSMEAIAAHTHVAENQNQHHLDVRDVTQAIVRATTTSKQDI